MVTGAMLFKNLLCLSNSIQHPFNLNSKIIDIVMPKSQLHRPVPIRKLEDRKRCFEKEGLEANSKEQVSNYFFLHKQ